MEKIEFLASTGLTFYSPEEGYRFPDELLSKSWNYRVLQEPNSAICLELGDKPIVNAVSGDQLLKDIGGGGVEMARGIINYDEGISPKDKVLSLLPTTTFVKSPNVK